VRLLHDRMTGSAFFDSIGGERGARTEAQNAGGENGRDFAEALVGCHGGRVGVESHGNLQVKRPQRPVDG